LQRCFIALQDECSLGHCLHPACFIDAQDFEQNTRPVFLSRYRAAAGSFGVNEQPQNSQKNVVCIRILEKYGLAPI
jgi:hypothetical protein